MIRFLKAASAAAAFAAMLGGDANRAVCAKCRSFPASKGQAALSAGLAQYEAGQDAESLRNLQSAIQQGAERGRRVNAHKHVASSTAYQPSAPVPRRVCKALAVDPSMDLRAAEKSHPGGSGIRIGEGGTMGPRIGYGGHGGI